MRSKKLRLREERATGAPAIRRSEDEWHGGSAPFRDEEAQTQGEVQEAEGRRGDVERDIDGETLYGDIEEGEPRR